MSKLFGKKAKQVTQPTGFETLPDFAQGAFRQAVESGQGIGQEAFTQAGLTDPQQAALGTLEGGLQPFSAEQFQTQLGTFQDPFEEQVIQNALRDLQTTGQGFLSDIGEGASAAGGFGGTRQALLESDLGTGLAREAGNLSGRLRSQGFRSASEKALENLARPLDVAGNLFRLGETERGIATSGQQAPAQQAQFLANLAGTVPGGGGGISFRDQPGLLQKFGEGGAAFGRGVAGFGSGLSGIGGGLQGLGGFA